MQHDPRPHIRRRSFAMDRLRSLSTAAAVAGLAGTAGLGIVAAASWSGEPTATPLPAQDDDGTVRVEPTQRPATTRQQQPATGGFAQPPTVTTPRTGRGGGHAATGGSN